MPATIPLSALRFNGHVRAGETIAWPQAVGEPLALTERLMAQRAELEAPGLFLGMGASRTLQPEHADRFRILALNGAGTNRRLSGVSDIVPAHVSSVPALLRGGACRVDVALVQLRPHPEGGYTLGVIADYTQALIGAARCVIAFLNPALPLLGGDARVPAEDVDVLVEDDAAAEPDRRIIDLAEGDASPVEQAIARRVAALVPDRATVQLGIGTLPVAIARALAGHRGLGVHSGVVPDALVDLIEAGAVTNAHKGRDAGRTVTGGLFGTRRLRDFAEASGAVDLRSVEYTHALAITATLPRFHTMNSAIEVDVTGQANAEMAGDRYLGAVGGQVDFVRGGMASAGGRSIIALPSTTADGAHSRIVASLAGRPVTTARSDVDLVVTEHGTAELRGCPLRERARRMIAIADPAFREALERAWRDGAGPRSAAVAPAAA